MAQIIRKCQGCQKLFARESLIKITQNHITKELVINPDSKITGRSVYVCKNPECFKLFLKKKRIEKNFNGKQLPALSLSDLEANLEGRHRQ